MQQSIFNSIKGSLNVITGCGSGLGRATLQWFLKNGSGPILAIDRHYEPNFEKDLGLSDDQLNKILIKSHDTFDEAKTDQSLSEFVSKYGSIDNVINVAGVALTFILNEKTVYNLENANNLIDFNTVGTFNITRLASKYMVEAELNSKNKNTNRTKCIINTSCISTTKPALGQTFYAGTKASLDSMTLCIARELSPFKIRCNTINVGHFDTQLLRCSDEKVIEYLESYVLRCPKRIGRPEEFAHLVQSIIENQMLNGCCIKIDACSSITH